LLVFFNFSFLTLTSIFFSEAKFEENKPHFDFSEFLKHNQAFSKDDISFLEWFIGFSEGDGNFGIIKSKRHRDRAKFTLSIKLTN
jgi:hypothetical protein